MRFDRALGAVVFSGTLLLLSVAVGTVVGMYRSGGQSDAPKVQVNISGDSGVSYVGAVGMNGDAQSASGTLGDEPDTYDLGRAGDTDTARATIRRIEGDGKLAVTILVDGIPAVAGQSSGNSYEAVDIQWFYQGQPSRT